MGSLWVGSLLTGLLLWSYLLWDIYLLWGLLWDLYGISMGLLFPMGFLWGLLSPYSVAMGTPILYPLRCYATPLLWCTLRLLWDPSSCPLTHHHSVARTVAMGEPPYVVTLMLL